MSRRAGGLVLIVAALALVLLLSISVGARPIPVDRVWGLVWSPDGSDDAIIVHDLRIPRTILGLTMPPAIERLFGKQFYAQISAERLDLLDTADVLVLVASRKPQTRQLTASRSYKGLRAVREDRLVRINDPDLAIAMSYSSVLSTPYQLREVVPRLRAALA